VRRAPAQSLRRGARGLTLIEVLAAVALLGLVYTALASRATQGVMSENDSLRRFHASLLADQALAAIETTAAMQETPELGNREEESEDGIYRVRVEVSSWDVPLPPEPKGSPDPKPKPDNILGGSGPDAGAVLQVSVRVTWDDLFGERSVERMTFVLDHERIRELAPDEAGAEEDEE
jgi:prepilin-type N-terminal cleavage/methylation domain-containing protein